MLVKFDPKMIRVERVKFKQVSMALGGSIRYLDEAHFKKTGKEKFRRLYVPMAIARNFNVRYMNPRFIQPLEGAITFYADRVLALELQSRDLKGMRVVEGAFGKREWITASETAFDDVLNCAPDIKAGKWFFDGTYVYAFASDNIEQIIKSASRMTKDGLFREVRCKAFNLTRLANKSRIHLVSAAGVKRRKGQKPGGSEATTLDERSCMAVVLSDKQFTISPPIWKQLGHNVSNKGGFEDKEDGVFESSANLEAINGKVFVNLSFALACARDISEHFGYHAVTPLQLPRLMIQLKTVNLPHVDKTIKSTHDIGLTFIQGLAWLLGLLNRAKSIEQSDVIRRHLKYLTTKGIYRREKLEQRNIRKDETVTDKVPMVKREQALENFAKITKDKWAGIVRSTNFKGRVVDILDRNGSES